MTFTSHNSKENEEATLTEGYTARNTWFEQLLQPYSFFPQTGDLGMSPRQTFRNLAIGKM